MRKESAGAEGVVFAAKSGAILFEHVMCEIAIV